MDNADNVDNKLKDEKNKNRKKKEVREGSGVYQPPQVRRSLGKTPEGPKPAKARQSCSGIYVPPQLRASQENLNKQWRSEPKKSGRKTPTNIIEAVPSTSHVYRFSPTESPISRTFKGRGIARPAQQQPKKNGLETKKPDDEPALDSSSLSIDESPSKRTKMNLSKSPEQAPKTISPVINKVILPTLAALALKKEPVTSETVEKSSPITAPVSSEPPTASTSQRPLRTSTIRVKPWEKPNGQEQLLVKTTDKRRSLKLIEPTIKSEKTEGKESGKNGNTQIRAKTVPAPVTSWRKAEAPRPTTHKTGSGGCCSDQEIDPDACEPTEQVSSKEKYIDSHCHLDFLWTRLNGGSLQTWMKQYPDAFPDNFAGCIPNFIQPNLFVNDEKFAITCDRDWIHEEVKNRYVVGASYGVHPHFSNGYNTSIEEGLREMLMNRQVTKAIAVGECGFDFYKSNTSKDDQIRSFQSQLQLAVEQELPVIIHCRGSKEEPGCAETLCLEIMSKVLPKEHLVHRHCFTQSWTTSLKWLTLFPNTFFGFTSGIAKRGADLSAVKNLPLDKLLLETDAPYFRPVSFFGKKSGPSHLSFPGMAIAVSEVIANARNITVDEVISATRRNTLKCYNIQS